MIDLLLAQNNGDPSVLILWGFVLMAVAVLLFVIELFVPTGGVLGLLSGAAVVASVVVFFRYDTTTGITALLSYLVLGPVAVFYGIKFWVRSPIGRRLILGGEDMDMDQTQEEAGYESEQLRQQRLAELRGLIGAQGKTVTPLRPVGVVKIEGRRIDALAEGISIEAGVPVVVTDVYDNQVKVRPV